MVHRETFLQVQLCLLQHLIKEFMGEIPKACLKQAVADS